MLLGGEMGAYPSAKERVEEPPKPFVLPPAHNIVTDGNLYVFEAPIDMLSYITLEPEDWQEHSYVAYCGTSIQPALKMLERVPQLDTVLLCLDNDEAGHTASQRMSTQLADQYSVERLVPENKDWNDDLTAEEDAKAQKALAARNQERGQNKLRMRRVREAQRAAREAEKVSAPAG